MHNNEKSHKNHSIRQNNENHAKLYLRFISLSGNPRVWISAAIFFSIVICFAISWLYYEQQDELLNLITILFLAVLCYAVFYSIHRAEMISEDLIDSKERYQNVLDTMLEGFQIIGFDWHYLYLNEEAVRQSGFPRERLMGTSFGDLYPGLRESPLYDNLQYCMNERKTKIFENEFIYPDGTHSWFNLRIQPVPEGIAVLSINISDQKKYEQELEKKSQELAASIEELTASEEELLQNYEELFESQQEHWESAQKFKTLADYTYDWEYWINLNEEFIYITPSVERITGYSPKDFYQKQISIPELVHPDDKHIILNHITRSSQSDEGEITFRIITRNNDVRWIAHTCLPIFDDHKNIIGRRGSNRDITDKKQVEEELKRSYEDLETRVRERTLELTLKNEELLGIRKTLEENQERLDSAQHVAHYGSWEQILQSGEFHCSPEELRIFGFSPGLTIPTLDIMLQRVHPEDLDLLMKTAAKVIERKTPGSLTHRIIRPDGEIRTIYAQMEVFLNDFGEPVRIVGSSQDITEINRALEEKQKTTREIHDLYNNAPCGYHSLDGSGMFIRINDTELSWLGYSRDEVINRLNVMDILTPESQERFRRSFPLFKKTGSIADIELEMVRSDGSSFWVQVNASAIYDDSGDFLMSRSILIDITEQKRYDEALSKSLHEKEILLKEIHHRVKNNMQVISSLLFMQARNLEDPAMIEIFNESQNRIRSLAFIHEKLYQSDDLDRIDYADYIKKIIDHLFQSYKVSPGEINVHLDISHIYLHIDKAVPCSLIINELISNSLKHAFPKGQKGEISIIMSTEEDQYHLTYGDTGIGLPDGLEIENGKSLGLQLIKGLVGQIGGSIRVVRDPGTVFLIDFPK